MLLLIYLIFIFFLFNFRRPASPGLLLIIIYIFSIACGLLIGYESKFDSYFELFNFIFLVIALTCLILPWNKFKYKISISEPDPIKLRRLTLFLFVVNTVAFVLFLMTCYYAFTTVVDYSAFKNEGGSEGFITQLPINRIIYLLALYLHPTSYFLIPLHFYYLTRRKYVYSIISLILSLSIILSGLTVFSRSGFVVYFFLYLLYLPFFYRKFTNKMRFSITMAALLIVSGAGVVFYAITANRFVHNLLYQNAVQSPSIVKNPLIFSIFDYFSQWYNNGNEVMSLYSFDILNGELSFPLVLMIMGKLQLIDYSPEMVEDKLYSIWGEYYDKFNGLVPNLMFDFGYLGTLLFLICYLLILRLLRPTKGILPFNNLLVLGVVFVLPAMGVFNSEMKTVSYNLLIIFSVMIHFYMMSKKSSVLKK